MPIFKHPKTGFYYLDITEPSGQRIRRSAGTKSKVEAQELHDKVRAEMWRIDKLNQRRTVTFDEAAVEFLKASAHQRDYRSKVQHVKYWREKFGGQSLRSLTTDAIAQALPTHRRSQYGEPKPLSGPTKNRYLATLSKMLNDAAKRGWLESVPYIQKYAEAPLRELFMTHAQAGVFLQALPAGWIRDTAEFALATGMRAGEILSLEWAHVNPDRRLASVLGSKAKSKSGRPVPLNDDAMRVIERRKGLHKQYVFARVNTMAAEVDRRYIRKAALAAGLPEGFRFHDLRHTWASWHAQAGTPLLTLQRLGGWKTLSMLNRYAHLSAEDLAIYSANGLISPHSTKFSQARPELKIVND